ncbi:MAG: glycosyltransferase family 2 protein, partial [Cyanobacteria bacterium J06632_19]
CTLQAFYEYLILLKVWEMKHITTPSIKTVTSEQLSVSN